MQDRYSILDIDADIRKTFNMVPFMSGLDLLCSYQMGFCDERGESREMARGKYVRPIICLAVCDAMGGDYKRIIPAAASIELIHRTSLVFDDIQDRGEERNHRPSMWTVWGPAQAINAGLALSCFARLSLYRLYDLGVPVNTILSMWQELEKTVLHLCQGQYSDIEMTDSMTATDTDSYLNMVVGKTATLFRAACLVGALGASDIDDFDISDIMSAEHFGLNLGILFQVHDDYLGVWGDEIVGKTANDLVEKKKSLPVLMSMKIDPVKSQSFLDLDQPEEFRNWMETVGIPEQMKKFEKFYRNQAEEALGYFPSNEATSYLKKLIEYFMTRDR